jgi:hypothetical protein
MPDDPTTIPLQILGQHLADDFRQRAAELLATATDPQAVQVVTDAGAWLVTDAILLQTTNDPNLADEVMIRMESNCNAIMGQAARIQIATLKALLATIHEVLEGASTIMQAAAASAVQVALKAV